MNEQDMNLGQHKGVCTNGRIPKRSDLVFASAFSEKYQCTGWYQLCLGRVSKNLSIAVHTGLTC